jgi:hypothetical protein
VDKFRLKIIVLLWALMFGPEVIHSSLCGLGFVLFIFVEFHLSLLGFQLSNKPRENFFFFFLSKKPNDFITTSKIQIDYIYIYIYIYVCMYVCIQTLKWGSFGDLNKWINEERHYIT